MCRLSPSPGDPSVSATDTPKLTSDVRRTSGGFELVLSPFLLAVIGFGLDRLLGLSPVLTILFAVVGVAGAVIKIVIGYDREMAHHRDQATWTRQESGS